jgi:hypothetical protein
MSNGFIYVVDAHFIDKIEEKKSWIQVPVVTVIIVDRGRIQTFLKEVANRGTQTQRFNFIENIISDRRRKK